MNNFLFKLNQTTIYMFLGLLTLMCFFPFFIMIINATHTSSEISTKINVLPGSHLMANYNFLLNGGKGVEGINIWKYFGNSLKISIPYILITTYFSSLTAYSLAFNNTLLTKIAFVIVLLCMMIPQQLSLIGLFSEMNYLHLIDTYIPHYITGLFNGMFIFFVTQYMKQAISYELIEAATVDGAGYFCIFHKIIFKLAFPAIATMMIFSFVGIWNNYILSLILLSDNDIYPLSLLIASLKQDATFSDYGVIYLLLTLSVLPILIIYVFLSRYIIAGLNVGGVKG